MSKNGIYAPLDFKNVNFKVSIDEVGVNDRLARVKSRSIKKGSKVEATKMAINMIDLTTLEGMDSPAKVKQLCSKAMRPHDAFDDVPSVAAVCVYPNYVKIAKKELKGSGVNVAAVSTAFPSGNAPKQIKIDDTRFAVDEGADEIDMVISRGKFLAGEYKFVFDEIAMIKEVCGKTHLKVILETGELETLDKVRLASDIAMEAGADFIKTSTGKIQPAATMPVTLVMLEAIREFYYKTGRMIGMKPAGGIKTHKDALKYLVMVKETLGEAWLNNKYFRFGASSLANELLMQLIKEYTGNYQAPEYFSID
ncbi:MAG TPA: deoxyribose-phosphate aldolase [Bacteroidetes bacterium]|nr:deoxyribose-phosphate aldolase [Bacteroidota bacterium]